MTQNAKDNVRRLLLDTGRRLVTEKGAEYLTARKLSEASGCSIGTIYNQFAKMDDFIAEQNEMTLAELYAYLSQLGGGRRGYGNINLYAGCFRQFVASHRPLWFLFYNFHLNLKDYRLSVSYRRRLVQLSQLFEPDLAAMFPRLGRRRLKMSQKVLETGLTALSALSSDGRGDKRSELLLNTYLAGMMMLNRE